MVFKKGINPWNKNLKGEEYLKHYSKPIGKYIRTEKQKIIFSNTFKNTHKAWKIRDPIGYFNHQKFAAIIAKERHPDLAFKRGKIRGEWLKKHPEFQSQAGKIGGKIASIKHYELAKKNLLKGCEIQSAKGFISKPEQIMKQLLPIDFIHGKIFRQSIPDFRSEERKIIIEVDGTYWHSSKNVQERDQKHNKIWQEKGYKIFRIPEQDINEYFKPLLLNEIGDKHSL